MASLIAACAAVWLTASTTFAQDQQKSTLPSHVAVWKLDRKYIVGGSLLLILQTALIVALRLQQARQRRSEESLHQNKDRYTLAFEAAPTGMVVVDRLGSIVLVNAQTETLFGYDRHDLFQKPVEMLVPQGLRQTASGSLYGLRKDGIQVPIEMCLNPLASNGDFVLASISDISDERQAAREKEHLTDHLHQLAGRLIEAQETERARIARDLHDDISQQLAAMSIALSALNRHIGLPPRGEDLHDEVSALQRRTMALADNVRPLSHDLHPAVLRHAGLVAALGGHCADLRRHYPLALTWDTDGDFDGIDPEAALCLYRVAQEALRNVVMHAGARHAGLRLRRVDGSAELTIADDGRGFDSVGTRSAKGLGLVSINERVRLTGGTVSIVTELDKGTRVRVPFRARQSARGALIRLPAGLYDDAPEHRPHRRRPRHRGKEASSACSTSTSFDVVGSGRRRRSSSSTRPRGCAPTSSSPMSRCRD